VSPVKGRRRRHRRGTYLPDHRDEWRGGGKRKGFSAVLLHLPKEPVMKRFSFSLAVVVAACMCGGLLSSPTDSKACLAVEPQIIEKTYEGNWLSKDNILSLKGGVKQSLVDHLGIKKWENWNNGPHQLRVGKNRLVVKTSPANHARIAKFLHLIQIIPGPAR
jgi:hypothetical protein